MIFSEQWIREWVDPPLTTQQLADQLTMAGLEVDGLHAVAGRFSGVVVAEVLSVTPHPDADKLSVCEVNDGSSVAQVVCGAANVRSGLKVAFARIDASLCNSVSEPVLTIKKAKLRGVESNGMLCSAQELGIAETSDGLMELPDEAPLGVDLREFLQLDDVSIELDLTPNRGDCLGIVGVAREIGALNGMASTAPVIAAVANTIDDRLPVEILAPDQCPRYLGRIVRHVNIDADTPLWMKERLRRSGLRSIDPVVDVTNYVLLELGQPMHAFDLGSLQGGVKVRLADEGEAITLLDGKAVVLNKDVLLITDHEKPLALAGIMGGQNSGVNADTCDIFLECAFFAPLALAGRARRYGLHTDASHRYERGVDFEIQSLAMERATSLLIDIAGGQPGPVVEALGMLPEAPNISFDLEKLAKVLGVAIPVEQVTEILRRLGMDVKSLTADVLQVAVPSFRFDISLDVDLIEEIARVYGYNKLPRSKSLNELRLGVRTETRTELSRLKDRLISLGYQEIITYSFVEPSLLELINPGFPAVALQNPISADMSVMRTTLWPGLLNTLKYNVNRQQDRVRIFESGQVFLNENGKLFQPSRLAGLVYGNREPYLWCHSNKPVDFYDIKGDVESLVGLSRNEESFAFKAIEHAALHPGQSAALIFNGVQIGLLGALSPVIQRELDLSYRVYLFEIDLDFLQRARISKVSELSKFPEVKRDIAIVIDNEVSGGEILETIRVCAGACLIDLRIFDVYQGDAVEKNKKSIALGLTLQHPSRTLGDEDINGIINSCVKGLQAKFNAKLRN
jgi:phenylalanyl-tRNA synthetase beta chain